MCALLACCLEGIPVSASLYFPTAHVTRVKVVLSFHAPCLEFPRRSRNDMSISTRERIVHRFSHANEKQRSTFAVPFISRLHANPTQSVVHSTLMYSGRTGTQESVLKLSDSARRKDRSQSRCGDRLPAGRCVDAEAVHSEHSDSLGNESFRSSDLNNSLPLCTYTSLA